MADSKKDIAKERGPGVWHSIHILSMNIETPEQEKDFIRQFKILIDSFGCEHCTNHANNYIKQNPIERYVGKKMPSGKLIGMFEYTWIFHNNVNSRTGRKLIDWETAYNMYSNPGSMVCSRGCGDDHKVEDSVSNVSVGGGVSIGNMSGMSNVSGVRRNIGSAIPSSNQVTIRPLIFYKK